jgi:molybdopterin synthase catalytic subunit
VRDVRVQLDNIDPGHEQARLEALGVGAIATFTGLVRGDDGVDQLHLEHYPGMTERSLDALCVEASARWPLAAVILIHRVGSLAVGERIVFVGTASAHRASALEACTFLIDRLKTDAPFWKKERASGQEQWVEARESDDAASNRWRSS